MTKETVVEAVEEKVVSEDNTVVEAPKAPKASKAKVAKKLTLAELKKESKKLDEQKEVVININGTDYTIKYDLVFRKTKQRAVLEDVLYFFKEIGEQNIEQIEMASAYTSLLIIKHFTDLDVPDEIDEALLVLEEMVDMGLVGSLMNELPEDEVLKIFDLLTQTVNNVRENLEMNEKEAKLLEAEIQNKELLEFADGDREEEEALEKLRLSKQAEAIVEEAEADDEE